MKRFVRILITTIFLLFGFISCSLFTNEEESSVTITFNGADLARSAERTMTLPSDSNDYYLVASILGDYKEAKMIPFSSLGTYTVRFNSVPIGAEIYVEANAYDVAKSDGNARINRFAFFTKSGNWFYKHRDKSWDKSYYEVSHRDETGYVLDYLKKFAD